MSGIFIRLLFKAFIPVVMLFGMMSYMMYMQGKDPFTPFKNVTSGMGGSFFSATESLKEEVVASTAYLGGTQANKPMSAERVYRWVDKNGVTHFGTFKPDDQVAFETIRVNPNHNIMDPFVHRPRTTEVTADSSATVPTAQSPPSMSTNPLEIKQMLKGIEDQNTLRLQQLQSIP